MKTGQLPCYGFILSSYTLNSLLRNKRACSQPSNPLVGISQRRLEILQWLSPLDHREKFHELRRKRVRLSDSNMAHNSLEEFNNFASKYSRQLENFDLWRNRELSRPETPNTLWCHGAAGSGKSMLTYVTQ